MRVHAALLELSVVKLGFWRQGQETHEDFLIPCLFPLVKQLSGVIRVLEVLVTVIAAHMAANELVLVNQVSLRLHSGHSRDHTQQCLYEGFSREFVLFVANGIKIMCQCGLGNDMSQIREGETVAPSDFMPTLGDGFEPSPIDPCNGSCHHREVNVIVDGMGIARLGFATANVLLDFLETGFDFPPGAIVLDDLFNRQMQVSRKEGNPLCFTKDPDHADRAFERLEHDHRCRGHHLAVMSIEKHAMG